MTLSTLEKIFLATALIFLAISCSRSPAKDKASEMDLTPRSTLMIGGTKISVEIADTAEKRNRGLSGRTSMEEDQGMLFDFKNSQTTKPGFWMIDMKFDLDLIWIKDNRVIEITKSVPHPKTGTDSSELPIYYPEHAIDTVVEVNSGFSDRRGIKVGDVLTFN